jgi:hypothetical protein
VEVLLRSNESITSACLSSDLKVPLTLYPRSNNCLMQCKPMKPVAPVTKTFSTERLLKFNKYRSSYHDISFADISLWSSHKVCNEFISLRLMRDGDCTRPVGTDKEVLFNAVDLV